MRCRNRADCRNHTEYARVQSTFKGCLSQPHLAQAQLALAQAHSGLAKAQSDLEKAQDDVVNAQSYLAQTAAVLDMHQSTVDRASAPTV